MSKDKEPLPPELAALETALASLVPRAPTLIDRDRLMFLAGQAAAARDRRRWLWPLSTAASLLLAVSMAAVLVARGGSRVGEPIVLRPDDSSTKTGGVVQVARETEILGDYLRLRRLVIEGGVDMLAEPSSVHDADSSPPAPCPPQRDLLQRLLNG